MKRFPKGGIRKNAQEFVDADYLNQLSPEDREWYDNFIKSEYGANHTAAKKIKGANLTKAEKKRINSQNNRRIRDVYNHLDRSVNAETIADPDKVESED